MAVGSLSILPTRPSDIIALVIADLEENLKRDDVVFDMGTWVDNAGMDGYCAMCLAGSVMYGSLGLTPTFGAHVYPSGQDLCEGDLAVLHAIDTLRRNGCAGFLRVLIGAYPRYPKSYKEKALKALEDQCPGIVCIGSPSIGAVSKREMKKVHLPYLYRIMKYLEERRL